jgi:biotin carboxyl carrier protein
MSRASRSPSHPLTAPETEQELYELITRTVRPLVRLAEQAGVEELRVRQGALQVIIRREHAAGSPMAEAIQPNSTAGMLYPVPSVATPAEGHTPPASARHYIRAGVVGFFHLARPSSRGPATPAVTVGQHVKSGQVVGYIEAMSVISEVESDADGEVVAILAREGQPVEYGQPLIELRLDRLDQKMDQNMVGTEG